MSPKLCLSMSRPPCLRGRGHSGCFSSPGLWNEYGPTVELIIRGNRLEKTMMFEKPLAAFPLHSNTILSGFPGLDVMKLAKAMANLILRYFKRLTFWHNVSRNKMKEQYKKKLLKLDN